MWMKRASTPFSARPLCSEELSAPGSTPTSALRCLVAIAPFVWSGAKGSLRGIRARASRRTGRGWNRHSFRGQHETSRYRIHPRSRHRVARVEMVGRLRRGPFGSGSGHDKGRGRIGSRARDRPGAGRQEPAPRSSQDRAVIKGNFGNRPAF
jgi:hypothetical protein